jgi:hypothetical protein
MDATLILIDSDAELLRARALVGQLWNSNDPADVARLEASVRGNEVAARAAERRRFDPPPDGFSRADLIPLLGTPNRVGEVMRGKKGLSLAWCSVCAPVFVCRPICSFRLRRSHRPGAPRSERRPDLTAGASRGGRGLLTRCLAAASVTAAAWTCFPTPVGRLCS